MDRHVTPSTLRETAPMATNRIAKYLMPTTPEEQPPLRLSDFQDFSVDLGVSAAAILVLRTDDETHFFHRYRTDILILKTKNMHYGPFYVRWEVVSLDDAKQKVVEIVRKGGIPDTDAVCSHTDEHDFLRMLPD